MAPVVKAGGAAIKVRPRVLIVDDEPGLIEVLTEVVGSLDCQILTAGTLSQARKILESQDVEVMLTDVHLPDGDGVSLVPTLRSRRPSASAIVITGSPNLDNCANAFREGAIDFIAKPFSNERVIAQVRKAIATQARAAKDGRKIERLRLAVKRLNKARKLISKKVDLLCNDLVSAYGELSKQLDVVRNVEGFRKYIANAKDLEQLLCHAMDWLMREIGYSNVAVWLAGEDGEFQLGAYMKYTVPGEPALTEAIRRVVLPLAGLDTVVRAGPRTVRPPHPRRSQVPPRPGDPGRQLHLPWGVARRFGLLSGRTDALR